MKDQVASSISSSIPLQDLAAHATPDRRAMSNRQPLVAAIAWSAATAASIAIGSAVGAASVPSMSIAALAAALVVSLVGAGRRASVPMVSVICACLLSALAATSLFLFATGALPDRAYGDGRMFTQFVADGHAVPRWLVGSAAASVTHAAIWEFPPVRARLPEPLHTPLAFLTVLETAVMIAGTWVLLRRWRGQLSVLLPALTPIWVLFASAYVEYYPLIAVPFVAALAWVFDRPLEERTPLEIAALTALLPLLYVGFLPAACLIFIGWAAVRPHQAPCAMAVAAGVAVLTIVVCWPSGLPSYFRTLYAVLNFGDAHLPDQYVGQVAGPASILFTADAAMSWSHARDVLYLLVWGGGWWTLPLVAVAASRAWLVAAGSQRALVLRDARLWLGAALVAWHVYYLVFMVPRLGLRADIDLFFPTYLTLAFVAGALLDRTHTPRTPAWTSAVLACALTALACAGPWLVWLGLPPSP